MDYSVAPLSSFSWGKMTDSENKATQFGVRVNSADDEPYVPNCDTTEHVKDPWEKNPGCPLLENQEDDEKSTAGCQHLTVKQESVELRPGTIAPAAISLDTEVNERCDGKKKKGKPGPAAGKNWVTYGMIIADPENRNLAEKYRHHSEGEAKRAVTKFLKMIQEQPHVLCDQELKSMIKEAFGNYLKNFAKEGEDISAFLA